MPLGKSIRADYTGYFALSLRHWDMQKGRHAHAAESIMNNAMLTTREAAERLGVSVRTVQLWVEQGLLAAWKTAGGHRRIPHEDVDRLLKRWNTPNPPNQPQVFRLLIVEDDLGMRKIYRSLIGEWGFDIEIIEAEDGFEGLIRLGDCPPDLLITDLAMPNLDGFALIRSVRRTLPTDKPHILVVTALSPEEIEENGGLPEDIPVLQKPLEPKKLRQHIEERLGEHAATR